jgi:hypothetical protein
VHKALVFCSFESLDRLGWLVDAPGVDVALVYYGSGEVERPPNVRFFAAMKGFKIPNFLQLARLHPEVLEYDDFLFVDDDMVGDATLIERWLTLHRRTRADVSQPSLDAASRVIWPHLRQRPGRQVRYLQLADAHRQVEALGHDVDHAVVQRHLDGQAFVAVEEAAHRGHQVQVAEGRGRRDAQRGVVRGRGLHVFQLGQQAAGALEEGAAGLGEPEGPAGAVEQL